MGGPRAQLSFLSSSSELFSASSLATQQWQSAIPCSRQTSILVSTAEPIVAIYTVHFHKKRHGGAAYSTSTSANSPRTAISLHCGNVVTEPVPSRAVWRIQRLSPHEVYRPSGLIVVVLTLNNGFQELLAPMMLRCLVQAFRGHVPSSSELARESEERFDAHTRLTEAGTILIGQQT